MTDVPFFDPWPEPDQDQDEQQQELDLPWMPPAHVAGVVVPLATDVYRGDDVVVQVTHVIAYERGLEVHVGTWLRPGTRQEDPAPQHRWHEPHEARIGIRLADGARLGHRPPYGPPDPDLEPELDPGSASLSQTNNTGSGLHTSSSWWLQPFPHGATCEVVVAWEEQGVPESSVALDLDALRRAATGEEVLWDPPPALTEGDSFGWFAYAPMSGAVYTSSLDLSFDRPDGERDPEDD